MKNLPLYLQIAREIEDRILAQDLEANERVPSTNEFAQALKVNPATAGKGLKLLVDAGVLYQKRGMGTFVSEEGLKLVVAKRREDFQEESLPQFIHQAQQLDLSEDDLIKMIRGAYART